MVGGAVHSAADWYYTRAVMGRKTTEMRSSLAECPIDMQLLSRLTRKPRLFTGRERSFWTDPYVASHVLQAHLDPTTDDASRRPEIVEATVSYLLEKVAERRGGSVSGAAVLDLACGPGIYAEEFSRAGCDVTGIDVSKVSIDYAEDRAGRNSYPIRYRCEDMLKSRISERFDLITVIYGEFCTLSERERTAFLSAASSAFISLK